MRFLYWLILFISFSAAAVPVVPSVPGGVEPGVTMRVFGNHDDFSLLGEASASNASDNRKMKELMIGGYYQPWSHLKFGAFLRQAYGLRHDNDWAPDAAGNWQWLDTNGRAEDIVILDATQKVLLADSLAGEIKTRYQFNTYNAEKTLFVRPGLSYFLTKNDQPFWNFFVQYEMDFPLNYGNQMVYEQWAYLGALYSATKSLDVGGFIAQKWQTWGTSALYQAKNVGDYSITTQTTVLCATLIYQFEM